MIPHNCGRRHFAERPGGMVAVDTVMISAGGAGIADNRAFDQVHSRKDFGGNDRMTLGQAQGRDGFSNPSPAFRLRFSQTGKTLTLYPSAWTPPRGQISNPVRSVNGALHASDRSELLRLQSPRF